jgi:hypothetical protein
VLLLLKPDWPLWDELHEVRRIDFERDLPNVQLRRIPGYDSRLRPLPIQRFVNQELDAALERVLAREQPARSALRIVETR